MTNFSAETSDPNIGAVTGTSTAPAGEAGPGVLGTSPAAGVWGVSSGWQGVVGQALETSDQNGVWGESFGKGFGVYGTTATGGAAVAGVHTGPPEAAGPGIHGVSAAAGVWGESSAWQGVVGQAQATSNQNGVWGETFGPGCGVYGTTKTGQAAIRGEHTGAVGVGLAGHFIGNVEVTKDLTVHGDIQLSGADLAEEFGISGPSLPPVGSVVVLAGPDAVRACDEPYDARVAGVVSGAGGYRPGITLDRRAEPGRRPLALTGKVWCLAEADSAPITLGDMLTTSDVPGHAMRAADRTRAFGAVLGKALGELPSGRGLIPVLVALQ